MCRDKRMSESNPIAPFSVSTEYHTATQFSAPSVVIDGPPSNPNVTSSVAALLLIAALAYKPTLNMLNQRQHEGVIAALQRPGMENIRNALAQAASLGDRELREIMEDERTPRAIIAHISQADDERLDQWLAFVRTFPPELQRDILDLVLLNVRVASINGCPF